MRIVHFEKGVFPELRRMIIAIMEWVALFLGLLLSADLLGAKYRDWNARRIAIKSERTLTAKYALSPCRTRARS
jgi:hypothetical protein